MDDVEDVMKEIECDNFENKEEGREEDKLMMQDEAGSAASDAEDSVVQWMAKNGRRPRLDLKLTGLTKAPLGKLGAAPLLQKGERISNGAVKGTMGVPPRKRLVQSLNSYHNPKQSQQYRKQMNHRIMDKVNPKRDSLW